MDIRLKRKYTSMKRVKWQPCKARTGNTHGPAKGRTKNAKARPQPAPPVLMVDGLTGKARFAR